MKKHTLALCLAAALAPSAFASDVAVDKLVWKAVTFGQSTDSNFGSTILPEKVGLNQVTINGKPAEDGLLADKITIESRGGKLANSHEGLTFYYTELPTDVNFTITADLEVEQMGPETGATPNMQEGAGIMVRDILGKERVVPQPAGHEEFPAAANMAMNLIQTHTRTNDGKANIIASFREGVYQPWGTSGNRRIRTNYVEGVPYGSNAVYTMALTRTNEGFNVSYKNGDIVESTDIKDAHANIVEVQNPKSQYVGFFASRNAKLTVSNVKLTLTPAKTVDAPKFVAKADNLILEQASSAVTATDAYTVQARANYAGKYSVKQDGKVIATNTAVAAGDLFAFPTKLTKDNTAFDVTFTATEGPDMNAKSYQYQVTKVKVADVAKIYVAANGSANGDGSQSKPFDLATAVEVAAAGSIIELQNGDYQGITVPLSASGTKDAPKQLIAAGDKVRFVSELVHQANYWKYSGIEVAGASFIVNGSHNTFEKMVTHGAPDTGFQITSPEKIGRALWASHNTVIDSESFNNMDQSQINADGFAAKMRIGDGNTFIRCISHHNIDDGWDLFNKVEDGANGVVTIIDSIAFMNGRTLEVANKGGTIGNGFKLGGEGLPVAHVIKNSLAFHNNMDGFTDNFNPGSVTVTNNTAIDNKRFNFIFRQSPYVDTVKQGNFVDNKSLRFNVMTQYDDVVYSDSSAHNWFIVKGQTVSQDGKKFDEKLLKELKAASVIDDTQAVPGRKEALALKALLK